MKILRADLARDDEASYRAMEPWSELEKLSIQLHHAGDLSVRAVPSEQKSIDILVQAHANLEAPALHFDNEYAIGRREFGGMALSQFAKGERAREIALAWSSAWATSADHVTTSTIELATDEVDTNLDALIAEQERLNQRGRKKMPERQINTSGAAGQELPSQQIRRLKELPSEFVFTTTLREGDGASRKGLQTRKSLPLPAEPPLRSVPKHSSSVISASACYQYDSQQLQKQGWAYVRAAFEDGLIEIDDYQAVPGVGADGAINWTTFIEMKSFARDAPSEVTFTESEFRRARECKGKFFLVIVSGLEVGFETEMRLYVDPLKTLPWSPKGSISVGGLGMGRALLLSETISE